MESGNINVTTLHENQNLMQKCITLLNNEWPRSEVARMRSIENSCPNLPTSLLLVKYNDEVIGHAKVSRLPFDSESCWIESVVVHPSYRGMGLGKLLMDACEQLAIRLKFLSAVLSTHDKQGFYEKLGYVLCDPVSLHGAPLPIKNTFVPMKSNKSVGSPSVQAAIDVVRKEGLAQTSAPQIPPPPLPKTPEKKPLPTKIYMRKSLNKDS